MLPTSTTTSDFDGPWKEALDVYLPDILAFFLPEAHEEIDWSQEYRPLDTELQQIAPDAGGVQMVDKLVQVRRHDGVDAWVLIHIEVQSQPDAAFAERMFRYHSRIYDRFQRQVASLAILGDDRPNWRPGPFGYTLWRCTLNLSYPTFKLLDYDPAILEASTNPCATVILAHRLAQATRHDPTGRMAAKLTLTRRLYRQGRTRQEIIRLYRFIDWLLRLPDDLEEEAWQQMQAYEEEQQMTYVTSAERFMRRDAVAEGRAQGITEGRAEGLRDAIAKTLATRFGEAGNALLPTIRQIADPTRLEEIFSLALTGTLDDIRAAVGEGRRAE